MVTASDIELAERTKRQVRSPDRAIAVLAERQHGVVSHTQLVAIGLSPAAIGRRVRAGRLHRLHRGVYAVGHRAVSMRGRWMAAVLAAGPGAALSHRSAAALWGIRQSTAVEVTVARQRRPRRGIVVHQSSIPADEVTVVDGIPVTTVPRTLLDLAAVVPAHQVERAANEADYRRLGDTLSLADLVERHPHRPGVAAVRALLAADRLGSARTRSDLEARFLAFLDAERLARPEVNAYVFAGGRWHECDCVWRAARVIVEVDGDAAHATRHARERDRRRDRSLTVAGWRPVRVTERQLDQDRAALAADLRALGVG